MFLFSIMITLTCTCTFAWGDDYSYSVVSYKFLKDEISFRGSEISSRRNDISHRFAATKFRFVEAKLRSNDTKFRLTGTKFRLMPLNFVSINLLALRNFADIRTIEAPKFRRFFVWSESSQFDCRNSRNFAYFGKFRLHFFCTVLYLWKRNNRVGARNYRLKI